MSLRGLAQRQRNGGNPGSQGDQRSAGNQGHQMEEDETEHQDETTCRVLCDILERGGVCDETFWSLVQTWTREFDMGAPVDKDSVMNNGHIYGQALTVYAYETFKAGLETFCLQSTLDSFASSICIHDTPLSKMTWRETQDVIMSLQIEFMKLFEFDSDEGFGCYVDIYTVLSMLMARIGFFESHKWKTASGESSNTPNNMSDSIEVLHGVVDVDEQGWEHVREESMIFVLDALHAMINATNLLLSAQPPPLTDNLPQADTGANFLFNHHLEASLDEFYDLSMISDCPVGSVLQYKHKFRYLFHSVSQVIFFHYPSYDRQKQMPLIKLQSGQAPHVNVLPLLVQVKTDIPILTEHTGLGNRLKHAETEWSWAIVGKFVLLVNRNLQAFYAQNLKSLLLHTDPDILKHV